jgi:hypothetical protein
MLLKPLGSEEGKEWRRLEEKRNPKRREFEAIGRTGSG